jgi:hypothetical protein
MALLLFLDRHTSCYFSLSRENRLFSCQGFVSFNAAKCAKGTKLAKDSFIDGSRAMMTPHQQGAIDMAKTYLLHGKDPALRRMAQEIIVTRMRPKKRLFFI